MAGQRRLTLEVLGDASGAAKALRSLESAAARFGSSMQSAGRKISSVGKTMTATVTVPIVAGLAKAVMGAADLQDVISATGAIFGAQAKEIEAWSKTATDTMGMSSREAMKAADAYAIVGKNIGLGGTELAKYSESLVQRAADLKSFYGGTVAQAQEAMMAALRGETDPIEKYGVMLNEATLKQKALELGIIKFTKGALTPQQKAVAASAALWDQTNIAAHNYADTADGASNQWATFTGKVRELSDKIGTALLPQFQEIVKHGSHMVDVFMHLSPEARKIAGAIVAVAAAAGPLAVVIGKVVSAFGLLVNHPVITAVALLAIGAYYAYTHFETFRTVVDKVAGALKNFGEDVYDFGKKVYGAVKTSEGLQTALAAVGGALAVYAVAAGASAIASAVAATATGAWATAMGLLNAVMLANPAVRAAAEIGALVAAIVYAYTHFEKFRRIVDDTWHAINTAFNAGKDAVKAVIDTIVGLRVRFGQDIKRIAQAAFGGLVAVVTAPLEVIKGIIRVAGDVLKGDWGKAWDDLKAIPGRVLGTVVSAIRGQVGAIFSAAKSLWDGLWKAAAETLPKLLGVGIAMKNALFNFFSSAASWLFESGKHIVGGLIEGIGSMAGALANKVKDLALLIPRTVGGWLGIHSPSTVMAGHGEFIVQGLVVGMDAALPGLKTAAKNVADTADGEVSKVKKNAHAHGKAVSDNVAKGIKAGQSNALKAAKALADKIKETLDNAIQGVAGRISAAGGVNSARTGLRTAESALTAVKLRASTIDQRIADAQNRLNAARVEGTEVTAEEQVAIDDALTAFTEAAAAYAMGEITISQLTVAQNRLNKAQADAVAPTGDVASAMQDLIDLQNEKVGLNAELADAEQALADAQLNVAQAQLENYKATESFKAQGPGALALFEEYATKAGLAAGQIRQMVDAMNAIPPKPIGSFGSKSKSWDTGAFNTGGGITSPNIITAVDLVAQKYGLDQAAAMELWATAVDGAFGNQQQAMDALGVHFAKGGVVSGPTFGLMGEYPSAASNPEIIAPQSIMRDTVLSALAESGAGGSVTVNVQGSVITERDLVDRIRRALLEEQKRGRTLVTS